MITVVCINCLTWLRRSFTAYNSHHYYHKTRHTCKNSKCNNCRILDDY